MQTQQQVSAPLIAEIAKEVAEALKVGAETYEGELEMDFLSRLSLEPSSGRS